MQCPKCKGRGAIPDPKQVGAMNRIIRLKAGLSLREVARRMRFSASYISDLELGRRPWNSSVRRAFWRATHD